MDKRLGFPSLETWVDRLMEAPDRAHRGQALVEAANGIEGVQGVAIWRALKIGGEERLTAMTVLGEPEALPSSSQVEAVMSGELSRDGLSRVQLVGATLDNEAPVLALACDALEDEVLDGLEALVTLVAVLEQSSDETALDSIRGISPGTPDQDPGSDS